MAQYKLVPSEPLTCEGGNNLLMKGQFWRQGIGEAIRVMRASARDAGRDQARHGRSFGRAA